MLVLVALLLSRRVGDVKRYGLRQGLAAYLALMFCLRDRELRERHLDRAGRQAGVDELGDPERRAAARDGRLEPHRDRRSHPVGAVDSARRLGPR